MWCAEACGEHSEDAVLDVAAALELTHMASLVHDDIIDGASLRRGLPTPHLIWGVHSAVLAGDYLFTRANKVALRYAGLGIASLLNQAIELTCEGEVLQNDRAFDTTVSQQDYLSHICRKTAALTGAACQAGALLAAAGRDTEESLLRFGIDLGCAFQIVDDIIDLTLDHETTGKPSCSDIRRGVMTMPLILAMRTPADRLIDTAFRDRVSSDEAIGELKDACCRWGCINAAREHAQDLIASAESHLAVLRPSEAKTALASIARAVIGRIS